MIEPIVRKFDVDYSLGWAYECVPIKEMRIQLDRIEQLGATHVELNTFNFHSDPYIDIRIYSERIETDEECAARLAAQAYDLELTKQREMAQLKQLKIKYEQFDCNK
jgi:hypothetical protein